MARGRDGGNSGRVRSKVTLEPGVCYDSARNHFVQLIQSLKGYRAAATQPLTPPFSISKCALLISLPSSSVCKDKGFRAGSGSSARSRARKSIAVKNERT
jgi:hypothetical protein